MTMLQHALAYARFGWSVFPVWPGAKNPGIEGGVKEATTDEDEVREWWRRTEWNIGIATGAPSGIVVIDVDRIPAIQELPHELPDTATVRTPNGIHFYFQAPEQGLRNSASRLAPGIDVRGDGGYVVAPPSQGTDGEYVWLSKTRPVPLPEWVLEALTSKPAEAPAPLAVGPAGTDAPR